MPVPPPILDPAPPDTRGFFAIASKPWRAVRKAALMCVIGGIIVFDHHESLTESLLWCVVVLLYAICWLAQSIHDFLADLHRRMDGGWPPAG